MSLRTLTKPAEVSAWSARLKREGATMALVPTMGFLHEGHLSLIREGVQRADAVAVSIFVNPSQFGPNEDLSRYPRDLAGDLAKCKSAGATLVYAPLPEAMYPAGFQTHVEVEQVSQGLCGARRPGHFRGVATVVAKLFALFRPDVALFGEKDFQQLQVIRALSRDLSLGVEVVGMPTVRESDGLAMSSRNAYLSPAQRKRALALSQGLYEAQRLAKQGEHRVSVLQAALRVALQSQDVREDYAEVVDPERLQPLQTLEAGKPARALVAGWVDQTRLIDNMELVGG